MKAQVTVRIDKEENETTVVDNHPRFLRENALFPPSIKKPSSFVFNDLVLKVAGEPGGMILIF